MKVTIEVDCTPEEARQMMGLPDLTPLHEMYLAKMREAFEGHEVCSRAPWIHGVRDQLAESFHPTADGQKAYAAALTAVTG